MIPKGKIIIIGGAVDRGSFSESFDEKVTENLNFFERGILKRIIDESKHQKSSRIEIVPTASKISGIVGREYKKALIHLGAKNVRVLDIQTRESTLNSKNIERIKKADVIFFTGGDQLRLTSIFGGTEIHDLILSKYEEEDFLYVGTSAGAACASKNMIYGGSSKEALLKGEIKITSGLGLIDNVIIDTHFVQRGRIGRLFQSVVSNPKTLGIGLGEDTGLLIKGGDLMEALGSGLVIIVDGRHIVDTNITDVEIGRPLSIKNLVVHVMSEGDNYCLANHNFTINKPND